MNSIDKFGLKIATINSLKVLFSKHSQIEKVILYGSRAKGDYKNGSDIDLTIVAPSMSTNELLKLENEIDDLMLPHKVDLSLQHQIESDKMLDHIQSVGVEFYRHI